MFTVKATYRNETRRFTFPESVLFPSYQELHQQLCRIFPVDHSYYLSRLIFSPDASKPGRILVGMEVHSAEDYDTRVAPLRRRWPNPLLRFTIFDGISCKAPIVASQRLSLYSDPTISSSRPPSPVVPRHDAILSPISHSRIPPPPPLPPLQPCGASPPPPPLIHLAAPSTPSTARGCDTARAVPCCSIEKGKTDIQVLLSSFKEDLETVLCRTLGAGHMQGSSQTRVDQSASNASGADVILPQTMTPPVGADGNTTSRWCFVCKTSLTGVWYGCIKCPWHAVCPSCFFKSHSAHTLSFGPSHVVQQHSVHRSPQASQKFVKETPKAISGNPQSPAPASLSPVEPALPMHYGVLCDSCNETIVGTRHKCLDCLNYDLCTTCMRSGAAEQHDPFHEFLSIETPGRVYVHTVFDTNRSMRNRQQLSSSEHTAAKQQRPADIPTNLLVRHPATCDLCDSSIVGERYKCVVCPDFDTCSSCFGITADQHPNHGFVKVNRPEDLMIRDPIPPRQVTHLAMCDSCQKTIYGARYKCMHPSCPDFDLCSDCEAFPIPVHPLNHPLLKLKTSDTVIPTVYRVGQTQMIDEPTSQQSALAHGELGSTFLPSLLANTAESPEPNQVVPGQVTTTTPEDQIPPSEEFLSPLGSPASQVSAPIPIPKAPSHLLVDVADPPGSPQSILPASDIYHQLWPRVNQEMLHLNAVETSAAGDSIVRSITDAITPGGPELLGAEESLPASPVSLPIFQGDEHHESRPGSPVPSTKSIVDGYRTPSSMSSQDQAPHSIDHQSSTGDQQEVATTTASLQGSLDATLVSDANLPDGQIFPPGAEFVKGWRIVNSGTLPWPMTTEVQFVAGETFSPECGAILRAKVGVVQSGQDLDVWTGDLKAPDAPGRYVGYWRLSDGRGSFFGTSVWIDLTVADHHSDQASEQSLAASSMVMPSAHTTDSINASDELHEPPRPTLPSSKTVTDEVEDPESDISSVSLVSVPTSDDEDAEWQDTRTHSEPMEYVVLYGRNSEE